MWVMLQRCLLFVNSRLLYISRVWGAGWGIRVGYPNPMVWIGGLGSTRCPIVKGSDTMGMLGAKKGIVPFF